MNTNDIILGGGVFCKDHRDYNYHMSGTITSTRHIGEHLRSFVVTWNNGTMDSYAWYESFRLSELP